MRLRRLLIENYGCFERADLRLAPEPGRINLIVAPNGAGKSVLRHAFHDLLFDIPMQSPMQFRFGYKGMRLHAEAVAADGESFEFGWARGAKPQQRVTNDPARYAALRAETSPDQLEQLFALDTTRLRKGGLDLKGGSTLAAALLSGTGELASARKVQAAIDARRTASWGPRQSKPPLNAAIAALKQARDEARTAVQRPLEREQQEQDLEAARQEHADAREEARQAQLASRRLNRISLTRPHLDALAVANGWFAANLEVPALPAGLEGRLANARAEAARTNSVADAAAAAATRAEAQLQQIQVDGTLEPYRAALSRLLERLGEVEKDASDLVGVRAEWSVARDEVAAALRDVGTDVEPGLVTSLLPTVDLLAASRAAIAAHSGLSATCLLCDRRSAEERRRVKEAEASRMPDVQAPQGLAELVKEIRADRNPAQHATSAAGEKLLAQAALDRELAKVPGWAGGAATILALPSPVEAAFERLDATRGEATARSETDAAELARLEKELISTGARLSALKTSPLPDDVAISAARARRDGGWRLVAKRAFDGTQDLPGEEAYAGAVPLAIAYERDVGAADDMADLRVRELERVDQAERLAAEQKVLENDIEARKQSCQASREAAGEAARAWEEAVAPLGLAGTSTMGELRAFDASRLRVVDAQEALTLAQGEALAVERQHAAWAGRLDALLGSREQSLAASLPIADARLDQAESARQAGTLREAEQKSAKAALITAELAQESAAGRMRAWNEGWAALLSRLGRPAEETPEATAAVLDRLADLARHASEAAAFNRRIAGMQADLDRFEADVGRLATELEEPLAATPFETARALSARWSNAAAQSGARDQAAENARESREAHERAEQEAREARQELDAVVASTGAADEEGAAARIAAAREYDRHAAIRGEAEKGLREHGAGLALAMLQEDAASVSAGDIAIERDKSDEAARAALERAENAAVRLSSTQRAFDDATASMRSVDAAAVHAAAVASFSRLLDEQLLLRVASAMLKQAMQHVEQEAGDKGLQRVSDAFGALTDGAYELALDERDGSTLLAIERRYPKERKTLDQLSEGTRDQLYMALRIVALRQHAASASPLPFIADDILQTFDDRRAGAALKVLLDLSDKLQVVILTHHEHLSGLSASLPPEQVNIQRLA